MVGLAEGCNIGIVGANQDHIGVGISETRNAGIETDVRTRTRDTYIRLPVQRNMHEDPTDCAGIPKETSP